MATYLSGFTHLEIQLEEIKTATNNFDDSKVIGAGGFGKVYKGELSHPEGKVEVAFKRLDRKHGQGDPEFFKEIRMLSSYKHDNLISLLGYCSEGNEMILMYEYASRGSLERILNDSALTWTQRLKICIGASKGLGFLHDPNGTQQRVLHCDIKSANILLDESLNGKVADFGLSKISPANQQCSLLVTTPVGTPGYCDPLYMNTYQLTKESDVYSFGVVLFEVLCGRVCYEVSDRKLKIFVPYWKKCYEQKKLDDIIFPDLMQQMNPSSLEIFVDIAYQCLHESREQRPTMSVVAENLKMALNCQELLHFKPSEYEQIIQAADPPLIYKSNIELIQTLTKGVRVNGGKTWVSVNEKGETLERIYVEACLDEIQNDGLKIPYFKNSRFLGWRHYFRYKDEMKVRVRPEFLSPLSTYSVNFVFRHFERSKCKTIHYKLNGEAKCCMVYDTYKEDKRFVVPSYGLTSSDNDGWFVVPLYKFTSDQKTADFEIEFEGFQNDCHLQVAGFEFQPLEEEVELHDQGLKEYQDIVKAASQSLFYKSLEELKELLSIGFHINNHKTWFSLNECGEHCEMLSIAHCLISREGGYSFYRTDLYSRFPSFFKTNEKGFIVHIRTQFLTPLIDYTVNIVFCKHYWYEEQKYVGLKYKLKGETETSNLWYAIETKDKHSLIGELYQFTSNGRNFDLEIVFEDHKYDLEVEGILFQPLEKVEHEQALEDEEVSNGRLQWTMKEKDSGKKLLKWFHVDKGQKTFEMGYAVDNNGKKCLMFSARGVIETEGLSFQSLPESRFGEVAVITASNFNIVMKIKSDGVTLSRRTYAFYLVYKYTGDQLVLSKSCMLASGHYQGYIHLLSPLKTPIIGQELDKKTRSQLKKFKKVAVPRQRSDGWMEVKVWESDDPESNLGIDICIKLYADYDISGLIIESIELRPITAH